MRMQIFGFFIRKQHLLRVSLYMPFSRSNLRRLIEHRQLSCKYPHFSSYLSYPHAMRDCSSLSYSGSTPLHAHVLLATNECCHLKRAVGLLSSQNGPSSKIKETGSVKERGETKDNDDLQSQREILAERARNSEEIWDRFVPERKMSFRTPTFYVLLVAVILLHLYNNHTAKLMEHQESETEKAEKLLIEKLHERREKRRKLLNESDASSIETASGNTESYQTKDNALVPSSSNAESRDD